MASEPLIYEPFQAASKAALGTLTHLLCSAGIRRSIFQDSTLIDCGKEGQAEEKASEQAYEAACPVARGRPGGDRHRSEAPDPI